MYIEKALNELNVKKWLVTAGALSSEVVSDKDYVNLRAVKTEKDFNERVRILVSIDEDGNEVLSDEIGVTWNQVKTKADEIELNTAASSLRGLRDQKLAEEVDPLVTNPLRWAELTDTKQAEWTQYRTDLLNLPAQSGFPNTVTWPTKPE